MSSALTRRLHRPAFTRALTLFVCCGALFYLGGIVWVGWRSVLDGFAAIGPINFVLGALLSSCAYLFRFMRWHWCLGFWGYAVPVRRNLQVYMAGLTLTASPGKVGETVRSILLIRDGVRPVHSVAAFVADRMADVLGICLLGFVSALCAGRSEPSLVAALFVVWAGSYALRFFVGRLAPPMTTFLRRSRVPLLHLGSEVLTQWCDVWQGVRVASFALCAFVAYGIQALVFAWFCGKTGIQVGGAEAVTVFVLATLFGAASMVPGGLGAMEAALVFQLGLLGVDAAVSVPVAIAIRMVTLWFGMLLGLVALIMASERDDIVEEGACSEQS